MHGRSEVLYCEWPARVRVASIGWNADGGRLGTVQRSSNRGDLERQWRRLLVQIVVRTRDPSEHELHTRHELTPFRFDGRLRRLWTDIREAKEFPALEMDTTPYVWIGIESEHLLKCSVEPALVHLPVDIRTLRGPLHDTGTAAMLSTC